jgi:hypothetical protein
MRIYRALPALLVILAASSAQAATVYYCTSACGANDESAFNTAFAALVAQGLTSSGWVNFSGATSGLTVSNVGGTHVDFTGANGVTTLNVAGTQLQQVGGGSGARIEITLSGNAVYAFGTHVTGTSSSGRIVFFETPNNSNVQVNLYSGVTTFVGVISDVPLQNHQFRLSSGSGTVNINEFQIAETPETATYVISGIGLIALALLKRRTRKIQPAAG